MPNQFASNNLGAVHSNYKTIQCKNFKLTGQCKYGNACSYYHDEGERRKLIDPLPDLPDGVTLPPMPEKIKSSKRNKLKKAKETPMPQPYVPNE